MKRLIFSLFCAIFLIGTAWASNASPNNQCKSPSPVIFVSDTLDVSPPASQFIDENMWAIDKDKGAAINPSWQYVCVREPERTNTSSYNDDNSYEGNKSNGQYNSVSYVTLNQLSTNSMADEKSVYESPSRCSNNTIISMQSMSDDEREGSPWRGESPAAT